MGLKNFLVKDARHHGLASQRLFDLDGHPNPAFEYFARHLCKRGYAAKTRERYLGVVAKFVDYLAELGVFSEDCPNAQTLNIAIELYPTILARGKIFDWRRYSQELIDSNHILSLTESYDWLPAVVEALELPPTGLARNSFSNTLAPLNLFLHLIEQYREVLHQKHAIEGDHRPTHIPALIEELQRTRDVGPHEVAAIRSTSYLGAAIRKAGGSMRRPGGLRDRHTGTGFAGESGELDFPLQHFHALLANTRNSRDRAMWVLLLGTGIRSHELKALRWKHIDIEQQKLLIEPPAKDRLSVEDVAEEQVRSKGTKTRHAFFLPRFKYLFFGLLSQYFEEHYVGPAEPDNFVFQILKGGNKGMGVIHMSDRQFIDAFKVAAIRAGVPVPNGRNFEWTPHSLRHAYGVYMLNFCPNSSGGQGYKIEEVQLMMGHSSIQTTRKYARVDRERLYERLQSAENAFRDPPSIDNVMSQINSSLVALP